MLSLSEYIRWSHIPSVPTIAGGVPFAKAHSTILGA